jgi:sugar phosphate isomerase/epimerase
MDNIHIHIPYNYLDRYLPAILEKGYNIELYIPANTMDNPPLKGLEQVKNALKKGTLLTWHAPYMDLSPGGVDEKIRRATVDRIKQTVEVSIPLIPKMIIVHPGFDDYRFNGHEDEWLENSLKTWKEVLDEYPDTSFAIENVFENRPDTIKRLIEEMDSERFRYCFDTGHFNVFAKVPLEMWMERLGVYIAEVHLHDNHGKEDEHTGMGEGNFDFDIFFHFLKTLGKHPVFTLEIHNREGMMRSIEYLKRRYFYE